MSDNDSFIQKLRMNNIFPPEGGGLPNPLIGMPQFYQPQQPQLQVPNTGSSGSSGGRGAAGTSGKVPNSGIAAPFVKPVAGQGGDDDGGSKLKGEHKFLFLGSPAEQWMNQWEEKDRYDQEFALKKDVANKKLSDETKQANALGLIGARGTEAMKQIDARGDNSMEQIGARGKNSLEQIGARVAGQKDVVNLRGTQAATQDAARVQGQKDVASYKNTLSANNPLAPSQQGIQEQNKARQLALTNPDLAQWLIIEPNGNFSVSPDAPFGAIKTIQAEIYGKGKTNTDIDISSTSGQNHLSPQSSSPAKPPTTPAKLTSKYKVSVE